VILDDGRYDLRGASIGDGPTLVSLIQDLAIFYGLELFSLREEPADDGQTVVFWEVYGWDVRIEQFITQLDEEAPGTTYSTL
jgi:hypothetical protein